MDLVVPSLNLVSHAFLLVPVTFPVSDVVADVISSES